MIALLLLASSGLVALALAPAVTLALGLGQFRSQDAPTDGVDDEAQRLRLLRLAQTGESAGALAGPVRLRLKA